MREDRPQLFGAALDVSEMFRVWRDRRPVRAAFPQHEFLQVKKQSRVQQELTQNFG